MKERLLDSWKVTGNDFSVLYEELKHLSDSTKLIACQTNNIGIFTCKEDTDADTINGYLHDQNGTNNTGIYLKEMYEKNHASQELISETYSKSLMLFKLGGYFFFTTKRILKTLCQRAGTAMGDFALRNEILIRFYRDAGYVRYMNTVPTSCQVLYREEEGAKKVFAVFAGRYRIIPQYSLIKSLIEKFEIEMGKSDLQYFSIDNFDTEIMVNFPKKAEDFKNVYDLPQAVIPGIHIRMSDTGDSSFIINGTFRIKNTIVYVPGAKYSRAHTIKADMSDIADNVENKVFVEYTKLPQRLLDLCKIDISPEKALTLIPKITLYCDVKSVVGLKVSKEVTENLLSSINPKQAYTAYDLALMFMDAGSELENEYMSKDNIDKIRSCFVQAAFFNYK